MSYLSAGLEALLLNDAAVVNLLGSNIFVGDIPEGVGTPNLYLTMLHAVPVQTHGGVSPGAWQMFMFEWSDLSYAVVDSIRKAVYRCLLSYRGQVETASGVVDIENILYVDSKLWPYDPDLRLHTFQVVLKVQYKEDLSGG